MSERAFGVIIDPQNLGISKFIERFPWIGGDLQTLHDSIIPVDLPPERGEPIQIPVPACFSLPAGNLLALFDPPEGNSRGLVILLHGLGGSSSREGLRRMGIALQLAGFAVFRLNMRGANPGRHLAGGTYAARCNSDLLPALKLARKLAEGMPLLGAGISLGGTLLINACLSCKGVLDGLFCASSPIDLSACSASIERPRNRIYQRWLLKRLIKQTLDDPFGVSVYENFHLTGVLAPRTIRAFDSIVTAPRWGFPDVESYYRDASPLEHLLDARDIMPPTLFLQALDDPWVPAKSALALADGLHANSAIRILFTQKGGHNGFHGSCGCWGDQLAVAWLTSIVDL